MIIPEIVINMFAAIGVLAVIDFWIRVFPALMRKCFAKFKQFRREHV